MEEMHSPVLMSFGHCSTCDREADFVAHKSWLRDNFLCTNCGSLPRERALMWVIDTYLPNWRDLIIHESSPVNRGVSARLTKECPQYISTQFIPGHEPGCLVGGIRCENLEALTFADETIDLHVSQDVLEHVFHPSKVFREIARTLKPGGMHIFTVPLVNKNSPSKRRSQIHNGEIIYFEPEKYHGSPIR